VIVSHPRLESDISQAKVENVANETACLFVPCCHLQEILGPEVTWFIVVLKNVYGTPVPLHKCSKTGPHVFMLRVSKL
jgi:hypothetical protein